MTAGFAGFDTTAGLAAERLGELDKALSSLNDAGLDDTFHESFNAAVESAEAYGYTAEDLIEQLPTLQTALTQTATAMGLEADSTTLAKLATGELTPVVDEASGAISEYTGEVEESTSATDEAVAAIDEHISALTEVGNAFLAARDATRNYEDALDDAYALLDEYDGTTHWDDGTEAARRYEEALDDVAGATSASSSPRPPTAMSPPASCSSATTRSSHWVRPMTSRRRSLTPTSSRSVSPPRPSRPRSSSRPTGRPPQQQSSSPSSPATQPRSTSTRTRAPAEDKFDGLVSTVNTSDPQLIIDAWVDTGGAEEDVQAFLIQVDGQGGTVTINGETLTAEEALATVLTTIDTSDGTVTINGQSYPAEEALAAAILQVNLSEGTLTIDGDNSGANSATDSAKAHADGTTGTINVDADTGGAESDINSTARDRSSTITASAVTGAAESALNFAARSRSAVITQRVKQVFSGFSGSAPISKAAGGAVHGLGTGTSDSIAAYLSNGEHVITAAEVALAGGA